MVMFLGAAKAPPVLSVEVPIVTYADLFVDYDAETKSPNRGGRIIKGGMKKSPGRFGWFKCGLALEVEARLGLGK